MEEIEEELCEEREREREREKERERLVVERESINFFGFKNKYGMY